MASDAPAQSLRPGQLVTSRAGRDQGETFVVLAVLDDRFVLVADGRLRRVAHPKKKNARHLEARRASHAGLAERLAGGRAVSDREVRAAILELVDAEEA